MDSSNRTQCIVVSGIDGSGKSTIIESLKKDLERMVSTSVIFGFDSIII